MLSRCVGKTPSWLARWRPLAAVTGTCLLIASPVRAQTALPPVTLGGGMQASFVHDAAESADSTNSFLLNSARFYVNGPVSSKIKFMFNTEYNGSTNNIGVLDAVARLEHSPRLNLWVGRFLPPSDRANLYGPYYSHAWAVYTDGIQDGYPFVATGRDNGAMYWGQFGKVKVSAGAFDGASATGDPALLGAARVMVDFWDSEDGYYLNGTYYGGKNLLAIGAATQGQSGDTASTLDFLIERKLAGGSSFSVESEYAKYDKLGGYDPHYAVSEGAYVLGSYLFGQPVGPGKFEVLAKYAKAGFTQGVAAVNEDYDQKTTELNLNYLIKEFNARVMVFFKNTTFTGVKIDFKQIGVGLQIQM